MSYINFKDLENTLKGMNGVHVKESIEHSNGVLRKTVFEVSPYTVTIEYVDFGKFQSKLNFYVSKEKETPIHFDSVDNFTKFMNENVKVGI